MREITSHQANVCNRVITIDRGEEVGEGGAPLMYVVSWVEDDGSDTVIDLPFQNGPISVSDGGTTGVNGLTHEVLLAILIDRVESFQAGKFANEHSAKALEGLKAARARHSWRAPATAWPAALRARTRFDSPRFSRGPARAGSGRGRGERENV